MLHDGMFVGVDKSCQFESKSDDDHLEDNRSRSEMVIRTIGYVPKE